MSLLPAHRAPQPVPFPSRPAAVYLMLEKKCREKKIEKHHKTKTEISNSIIKKKKKRNLRKRKQEWNGLSKRIAKSTLTYPKLSLFTILLQVNLDAGLKEIQLGLELLRHRSHGILHLGEAAVIPEKIHPAGTTKNRALGHLWDPNTISCTITTPPQMPRQVPVIIIIIRAATYNHRQFSGPQQCMWFCT